MKGGAFSPSAQAVLFGPGSRGRSHRDTGSAAAAASVQAGIPSKPAFSEPVQGSKEDDTVEFRVWSCEASLSLSVLFGGWLRITGQDATSCV